MVIKKLKDIIKSLSINMDKDKIKQDLEEIETINIELDHRVTKLIAENEHLKQTYKQLYDSIKPARVRSKEQCADLTNQVNLKSVEISNLNACLQEKVLVITTLKDELRKLKGKDLANNEVTHHPSDPEINTEPITPKLLNKRSAHSAYIKHTQEEAAVLRDLVDHIKANYPLDPALESACKYTKLIQELLTKISKTCPSLNNSGEQLVAVTPMNKVKRVRFTEPVTSSRNTITKKASTSNLASNKPMLSSTGVKPSTSASGSQPSGNTKKDKIQQTQSSTQKNKVEAHPRKVKSSLKNKDHVVAPKGTAHVQHSKLNANSELKCVKITTTTEAPLRKPIVLDNETSKPAVTLVYSRKPRNSKTNVPVSKSKVIQIVLWYLDSGCSKHMTGDRSQLTNFVNKFLGTVKFGNDHVAKILGYGDYQIRNVMISRVYYVEGLGHNLFSVGQFCDSNLEVAFRQHTCFIRNLEGDDLLIGSRGNNLYTLSLGDMMTSSPICLLSKASKTKSWLWHRRLSHLNFGAINHLARHGLVRGLPKLKFEKDHLCSACAMGKSKKKPHKPKSEDTNQEKLYLLHMDLCGPMRVASVNGKKSKDEAPYFIIKFLKMIQLRLKVPVRRIKTDNGTEFVNQTLREYYEKLTSIVIKAVAATVNAPAVPEHDEAETGFGDEIYSTVDACNTANEMWTTIERLQQGESLNVQDVKTNLFWEFRKFTSRDGESMESYYSRFYKLMNELKRNNLQVTTMQVNVQFLQQLQPEWSRFVTLIKQSEKIDTISYTNSLFDILKQFHKELMIFQLLRKYQEYQIPLVTSCGCSNQIHILTSKHQNLKIKCNINFQQDKVHLPDTKARELAPIAKYFKSSTNLPTTTFELLKTPKNKTEDTTGQGINIDNQSKAVWNQRTIIDGAKETVAVLWNAEESEEHRIRKIDEHELEAHYSFMAKIQEVLPEESSSTDQPLEQVQNNDENNVFANERRHYEQPESINDTYVLEKDDSNVTPDSSNICNNDN
ncbi:retrovirus-related pol polyprotein from transposon TNT 1-94 [Tanacetum coccineum]